MAKTLTVAPFSKIDVGSAFKVEIHPLKEQKVEICTNLDEKYIEV